MTENIIRYATIVRYEPEANGTPDYIALHPEIDGCFAQGDTPQEAVDNLAEVTDMVIAHLRDSGMPIPEPNPLLRDAPARLYWLEPDEPHVLREFAPVALA